MPCCARCNLDNAPNKCAGCSTARYCDRACQAAHWPTHKLSCEDMKAVSVKKAGMSETASIMAGTDGETSSTEAGTDGDASTMVAQEEPQPQKSVAEDQVQDHGNCWTCGTDNPRNVCTRCKVSKYCSIACQKENWPSHKKKCKNLSAVAHIFKQTEATLKAFARSGANIPKLNLNEILFNTCMLGRVNDIERLIAAGGNVNFTGAGESGEVVTPIHIATQEGHHRAIEVLVHHGALIDQLGFGGNTPLTLSATMDNVKVMAVLLKLGAQVDSVTTDGRCALLIAAHEGHTNLVSLLLQHGAQPNLQSTEGHSPLSAAARSGHTSIVRLLLQSHADPLLRSARGLAIEDAVHGNHPDVVALLLENGSPADEPNSLGMTLLAKAVSIGFTSISRILLTAGADPLRPGCFGIRPFDAAIQGCHREILTLLLEHGCRAQVNSPQCLPDGTKMPPLQIAIGNGDSEIVRILLEAGANPHRDSSAEFSPLNFALAFGHPPIVRLLLKAGSVPLGINDEGKSPLDLANRLKGSNKKEIVSMLKARIAELELEREKQDSSLPSTPLP